MSAKKRKPHNYYRLSIQWIILILLTYMVIHPFFNKNYTPDFEAYCPYGGMMALSSFLVNNSLACSMTTVQIAMGLALIIAVILVSKLFCSYVCPVGTFSEWLGKLGDVLKIRFTIKGIADRLFRLLKYVLLFITFYFTIESSELFCKKYDPYYALFSGFSSDVVLTYAIIAIAVMVIGAVFIRLFWCKYLCPLGAATNIFSNIILFVLITGFYFLFILVFKFDISWVWYLAAVCLAGFLIEAIRMKPLFFPLLKITRDVDLCTNCKTCDEVCPVAINVSEQIKVSHIDCHLCGDCIEHCTEKNVLKINRRRWRWIPPIAVVLLVTAGIYFSSQYELPTISERWGTEQQMSHAKEYTLTGLKNIKCFGSSMSFAQQMREVPGVLGVETFVKSHTVKVFYDPAITNAEKIKAAIFTPTKTLLRQPLSYKGNIAILHFGINNYFDDYDSYYLTELLMQQKNIYAFETSFGEPVQVILYYDPVKLNPDKIKKIIETPEFTYMSAGENKTQKLEFKVVDMKKEVETISAIDFIQRFIKPFDSKFNKYDTYKEKDLKGYRIAMPQAADQNLTDSIAYLVSHISADDGIVRFTTDFSDEGVFALITFVGTLTTEEKIFKELNSPSLTILYDDGTKETLRNPFVFGKKGRIQEPS
jgi:polyferredoxin/copper chaperone CopZ